MDLVALEVPAHLVLLIAAVSAIISSVTEIIVVDAQMILALESVLATIAASGEPRLTADLVGQVEAVLLAVTLQVLLDAVARVALELAGRTGVGLAVALVGPVAAVVVVVALPPARDAFVVVALEL